MARNFTLSKSHLDTSWRNITRRIGTAFVWSSPLGRKVSWNTAQRRKSELPSSWETLTPQWAMTPNVAKSETKRAEGKFLNKKRISIQELPALMLLHSYHPILVVGFWFEQYDIVNPPFYTIYAVFIYVLVIKGKANGSCFVFKFAGILWHCIYLHFWNAFSDSIFIIVCSNNI